MITRWILGLILWISIFGNLAVARDIKKGDGVNSSTFNPTTPPIRSLTNLPAPENFIAPGIKGIYAELQNANDKKLNLCGSRRLRESPRAVLKPYTPYQTPNTSANPAMFNTRQIAIKFVEGSGVQLRAGKLQLAKKAVGVEALEPLEVQQDLAEINKIVSSMQAVISSAAPQVDEKDLARLRRCGENNLQQELPDLNLFYFVHLPEVDGETALNFLKQLQSKRIIEVAYFQPIPFDAADIPPQTNIDVTPSQGYFRPSPQGIDVDFARHFRTGRGNGVRIADIESGWHLNHEDLPQVIFGIGVNLENSHGTAVLGELVAEENGFGANGIAPNASIGWSSVTNFIPLNRLYFYSVGEALLVTGRVLRVGDIALIEQHFIQDLTVGSICTPIPGCGCPNTPWVAVEEYPYEHAVISNLTAAGIIVVEAAGNGRTLVTPASTADSGAIVVGASTGNLQPACFSNFGPRVNVHGWGQSIGTTGYGGIPNPDESMVTPNPALRANGTDKSQWYTTMFGGTSSASAIVVGAAAIIQSTRMEVGLPVLLPLEMRSLLISTGTPQAAGSTPNIGPLPNLRRAIGTYLPDSARFISQTNATSPVAPNTPFVLTAVFANSGGAVWSGAHTMSVAPSPQSGIQEFQANAFNLGSPTEVFPQDQVMQRFIITPPSQPGTYNLSIVLKDGAGQKLASSPTQQIVVGSSNQLDNASITIIDVPGSLPTGQSAVVNVQVTNTGNTTWSSPGYSLGLQRGLRISLPQQSVVLSGSVAPGSSQNLSFTIGCNGSGQGFFSAQMLGGTTGRFGQEASRTVVCQ
jgi:serine protease